jgi:hypothetical protein
MASSTAASTPPIAIVAFSFGARDEQDEPNPCNQRLAQAAERIIRSESGDLLLISQWEVAEQLESDGICLDHVIRSSAASEYLDSDEVWAQALIILNKYGVNSVIPVVQPFLQMYKVKQLIRESGITIERRRIGWIGFDSSSANKQWWTKGPVRLFTYAFMQALGRQTRLPDAGDAGEIH